MSGKQATKDFYSGEEYVTNLDGPLWGKRGVSRCVVYPTHLWVHGNAFFVLICHIYVHSMFEIELEVVVLAVAGAQPPDRPSGWLSSTLRGARTACGLSRSSSGTHTSVFLLRLPC